MIHFYNKNSQTFHESLKKNLPQFYSKVVRQFKNSHIFIFDDVVSSKSFHKLASKVKDGNILNIFRKDDYIFIGPFMKSIEDACPYCFLLTISIDEYELEKLAVKSTERIKYKKKYKIDIKNIRQNVHCINASNGNVIYFTRPLAHPSCVHHFGKFNKKISKQRVSPAGSELLSLLLNKTTGLIREMKSLRELASEKVVNSMGRNEVIFSWFQNPVFPLFPQVGFLDLAIGTDNYYKGALTRAIFETLERYSVLNLPDRDPEEVGTYNRIKNKKAVNPARFWRYAPEQLSSVPFRNIKKSSILYWRKMFNPAGGINLIPEDFIYVNLKNPSGYHSNTTSGTASHRNFHKACISAILELIERDNVMRHWALGIPTPQLDLETAPVGIEKNIEYVGKLGFGTKIINCSRFKGIYTFIIFLINKKNSRPKVIVTSGCSYDPQEAILKGFREAIGSLLISLVLEERNGNQVLDINDVVGPEDHARFYRNPKYFKLLRHYVDKSGECYIKDLDNEYKNNRDIVVLNKLTKSLKKQRVNVYLTDLTYPPLKKMGISVVRAVSPELMPIIFGINMLKLGGTSDEKFSYAEIASRYPHPYS